MTSTADDQRRTPTDSENQSVVPAGLPIQRPPSVEPLTFGVEEEFFLVDRFGRCVPAAPEVLRTVAPAEVEYSPEVSEFQVESVSPVCRTAGELIGKLESGRRALAVAADRHGHRLVACGAPIHELDRPFPVTQTSRYLRIAQEMGAMLESLLTSGCHVHVGMPDLEHAVGVSNQLRAFLPGLLAMSANSPFHRGVDSGHASWRSSLWWQVPSAGPPPIFESVSHYQDEARELLRSGAALDPGMIYWLMRPSSHLPTLEIRIGDVLPTAEEALLFALLIRGLAATALIRVDAGLPPPAVADPTLRLALWRAARDGADGMVIDPMTGELLPGRVLIDRMIAWARPGLAAMGDEAVVTTLLAASRRAESPVARQRAAFARRNSIQDVVELLARRTRGLDEIHV